MESVQVDEAALVDDLLTATKKQKRAIQRARRAIVALKRCGYLEE